jgi:hypothetical protein
VRPESTESLLYLLSLSGKTKDLCTWTPVQYRCRWEGAIVMKYQPRGGTFEQEIFKIGIGECVFCTHL